MKRVICNQCRVEAPFDSYGLSPSGWLSVSMRGGDGHPYEEPLDFCSTRCTVENLSDRLMRVDEANRPPDLTGDQLEAGAAVVVAGVVDAPAVATEALL